MQHGLDMLGAHKDAWAGQQLPAQPHKRVLPWEKHTHDTHRITPSQMRCVKSIQGLPWSSTPVSQTSGVHIHQWCCALRSDTTAAAAAAVHARSAAHGAAGAGRMPLCCL
jgi:hypothetical protein